MSGFFGRLSSHGKSGKSDKETAKHLGSPTFSNSSTAVNTSHDAAAVDTSTEELDLGSPMPAPSGDEEPDEEPLTSGVHFVSFHQSLLQQRQSVLPHLTHRVWGDYTEDDLAGTRVRGPTYLSDNVKVPCGPALYTLSHADIFYTNKDQERMTQVASRKDGYMQSPQHAAALARSWGKDPAAATMIVNFLFPGPKSTNMNLALYFERRVPPADVLARMKDAAAAAGNKTGGEFGDETLVGVEVARVRAYDVVLRRFRQGSDSYRDGKVKIIPRVAEGNYIVKKSIGRIPALLGKKVKMTYQVDDSVMEMDADLGSSRVAGKIITLIKSTARALVVDMTFLLQGDSGDELPESLIGGVRISHCDIDKIPHYDQNSRDNAATFKQHSTAAH